MTEFDKTFNRIFVTGDIHGDYYDLANRVSRIPDVSKDDLLIILGDCAFFYYHYHGNIAKDYKFQERCTELPITILAIQGNKIFFTLENDTLNVCLLQSIYLVKQQYIHALFEVLHQCLNS